MTSKFVRYVQHKAFPVLTHLAIPLLQLFGYQLFLTDYVLWLLQSPEQQIDSRPSNHMWQSYPAGMAESRDNSESVGEKCHHNPELTAVSGKPYLQLWLWSKARKNPDFETDQLKSHMADSSARLEFPIIFKSWVN